MGFKVHILCLFALALGFTSEANAYSHATGTNSLSNPLGGSKDDLPKYEKPFSMQEKPPEPPPPKGWEGMFSEGADKSYKGLVDDVKKFLKDQSEVGKDEQNPDGDEDYQDRLKKFAEKAKGLSEEKLKEMRADLEKSVPDEKDREALNKLLDQIEGMQKLAKAMREIPTTPSKLFDFLAPEKGKGDNKPIALGPPEGKLDKPNKQLDAFMKDLGIASDANRDKRGATDRPMPAAPPKAETPPETPHAKAPPSDADTAKALELWDSAKSLFDNPVFNFFSNPSPSTPAPTGPTASADPAPPGEGGSWWSRWLSEAKPNDQAPSAPSVNEAPAPRPAADPATADSAPASPGNGLSAKFQSALDGAIAGVTDGATQPPAPIGETVPPAQDSANGVNGGAGLSATPSRNDSPSNPFLADSQHEAPAPAGGPSALPGLSDTQPVGPNPSGATNGVRSGGLSQVPSALPGSTDRSLSMPYSGGGSAGGRTIGSSASADAGGNEDSIPTNYTGSAFSSPGVQSAGSSEVGNDASVFSIKDTGNKTGYAGAAKNTTDTKSVFRDSPYSANSTTGANANSNPELGSTLDTLVKAATGGSTATQLAEALGKIFSSNSATPSGPAPRSVALRGMVSSDENLYVKAAGTNAADVKVQTTNPFGFQEDWAKILAEEKPAAGNTIASAQPRVTASVKMPEGELRESKLAKATNGYSAASLNEDGVTSSATLSISTESMRAIANAEIRQGDPTEVSGMRIPRKGAITPNDETVDGLDAAYKPPSSVKSKSDPLRLVRTPTTTATTTSRGPASSQSAQAIPATQILGRLGPST